jgi:hypothetical protein
MGEICWISSSSVIITQKHLTYVISRPSVLYRCPIQETFEVTKSGLFGEYYVVPTGSAIAQAETLSKGAMRPYNILRRHALKLALWPDGADADWDWIKSLEALHIGELRIDEDIAGNNNVRVIFFKADKALPEDPISESGRVMQRIWVIAVFQKKSQGFSASQLKAWKGMRQILIQRFYGST